MQEELRQKLIDEPLVEQQEQYREDPVQPITRGDAAALIDLLDIALPLGSIQVRLGNPPLIALTLLHSVVGKPGGGGAWGQRGGAVGPCCQDGLQPSSCPFHCTLSSFLLTSACNPCSVLIVSMSITRKPLGT